MDAGYAKGGSSKAVGREIGANGIGSIRWWCNTNKKTNI